MLHFNISKKPKTKGKEKVLQLLNKTDSVEVKLRFLSNQQVEVYTMDTTFIGYVNPKNDIAFGVLWEMWCSNKTMHTHAYPSHQGKKPSFFIGVWAR